MRAAGHPQGQLRPVWHANLTWLVVLGGVFFGAFPVAYGVVVSALYIPVFVMLIALAFRGVSFDFRGGSPGSGPLESGLWPGEPCGRPGPGLCGGRFPQRPQPGG